MKGKIYDIYTKSILLLSMNIPYLLLSKWCLQMHNALNNVIYLYSFWCILLEQLPVAVHNKCYHQSSYYCKVPYKIQ